MPSVTSGLSTTHPRNVRFEGVRRSTAGGRRSRIRHRGSARAWWRALSRVRSLADEGVGWRDRVHRRPNGGPGPLAAFAGVPGDIRRLRRWGKCSAEWGDRPVRTQWGRCGIGRRADPSLDAFGPRPLCLSHWPDRRSSETLLKSSNHGCPGSVSEPTSFYLRS
jgi:hypothetical protein